MQSISCRTRRTALVWQWLILIILFILLLIDIFNTNLQSIQSIGLKSLNGDSNDHIISLRLHSTANLSQCFDLFSKKSNASNTVIALNVSDTKSRILIIGRGHSGTTYIQQFIGTVLLNKTNTFYLYESTHRAALYYLAKCHGYRINQQTQRIQAMLLSDFYQCKFLSTCNYTRMYLGHHTSLINSNLNDLSYQSLRSKCLSSKYLIYKEIFPLYSNHSYHILLDKYPDLKVIAMVRNPLTHIPSAKRLQAPDDQTVDYVMPKICYQQLIDLKYALKQQSLFYVLKMEHFFECRNHKFNETIRYLANTMYGEYYDEYKMEKVLVNDNTFRMEQENGTAAQLMHWVNNPVTSYSQKDLLKIKNNEYCQQFADYNGYSLNYDAVHATL